MPPVQFNVLRVVPLNRLPSAMSADGSSVHLSDEGACSCTGGVHPIVMTSKESMRSPAAINRADWSRTATGARNKHHDFTPSLPHPCRRAPGRAGDSSHHLPHEGATLIGV